MRGGFPIAIISVAISGILFTWTDHVLGKPRTFGEHKDYQWAPVWVAALVDWKGRQFCVASAIHRNWMVTSYRCHYIHTTASLFQAKFCPHIYRCHKSMHRPYSRENVVGHPNYKVLDNNVVVHNDIALVHLHQAIQLNEWLSLPPASYTPFQYVTVFAWRLEAGEFKQNPILRYGTLPIIRQKTCENETRSANRVCSLRGELQPCHGDWGAPAVEHGKLLVAIISLVRSDCSMYGYSRMELISPHLDWINRTISQVKTPNKFSMLPLPNLSNELLSLNDCPASNELTTTQDSPKKIAQKKTSARQKSKSQKKPSSQKKSPTRKRSTSPLQYASASACAF